MDDQMRIEQPSTSFLNNENGMPPEGGGAPQQLVLRMAPPATDAAVTKSTLDILTVRTSSTITTTTKDNGLEPTLPPQPDPYTVQDDDDEAVVDPRTTTTTTTTTSRGCCRCCCSWWDVLTPHYATGLVFIVIVSVIWAGSSVVVQHLYQPSDNNNGEASQQKLDSPFAVTFIGVSLFTLWLPVHSAGGSWSGCCTLLRRRIWMRNDDDDDDDGLASSLSSRRRRRGRNRIRYHTLNNNNAHHHNQNDDNDILPPEDDDDDDAQSLSDLYHHSDDNHHRVWTRRDHWHAALYIAPVWFVANWTYNASLAYTSVTSSTVLASMGSLFTFMFAVLLRDEHFTATKCVGVLLGVAGSVLTAWHDVDHSNNNDNTNDLEDGHGPMVVLRWLLTMILSPQAASTEDFSHSNSNMGHNTTTASPAAALLQSSSSSSPTPLWGDLLGLVSAVGYGTYAVQTRLYCPKDESLYSMQVLLGYIGLIHVVVLGPVLVWQLSTGRCTVPHSVWAILIVKGLLDNVLSDYLWLRSVMLTNATVATVGLGLTIPLAFVSDVLWGADHSNNNNSNNNNKVVSFGQVGGALVVLLGFVLVNVGNRQDIVEQTAAAGGVLGHHDHDDDDDHPLGGQLELEPADPCAHNSTTATDPHYYWRTTNTLPVPDDDSLEDASERGQEVVTLRTIT